MLARVSLLVLVAAAPALAQQAGATCDPDTDDAGPNVNAQGRCIGDLLRYCGSDRVVADVDCSGDATPANPDDDYFGPDIDAVCRLIDDDYGFDCAVVVGGPCLFDVDGQLVPVHCDGASPGCVVDFAAQTATCRADAPQCTADGAPGCAGDLSVVACLHGQATAYDCASGGTTCGADGLCAPPPADGGPAGGGGGGTGPCGGCPTGTLCDAATSTCVPVVDDDQARDDVTGAIDDRDDDDDVCPDADDCERPERKSLCASRQVGGDAPVGEAAAVVVVAAAIARVRRRRA